MRTGAKIQVTPHFSKGGPWQETDAQAYRGVMHVAPSSPIHLGDVIVTPVYRVSFWTNLQSGDVEHAEQADSWRITDAYGAPEVLEWAHKHAGSRSFVLYVERNYDDEFALIRIAAVDAADNPLELPEDDWSFLAHDEEHVADGVNEDDEI